MTAARRLLHPWTEARSQTKNQAGQAVVVAAVVVAAVVVAAAVLVAAVVVAAAVLVAAVVLVAGGGAKLSFPDQRVLRRWRRQRQRTDDGDGADAGAAVVVQGRQGIASPASDR